MDCSGRWENEEDWRLIAPYCDVIGYDNYSERFADATLGRLIRETAKPVFAGEFSFPPTYGLARGFQAYSVNADTEAESGEHYAAWLAERAGESVLRGRGVVSVPRSAGERPGTGTRSGFGLRRRATPSGWWMWEIARNGISWTACDRSNLRAIPRPQVAPIGTRSAEELYAWNELPQPQVDFTFGFSNLNPEPSSVSM